MALLEKLMDHLASFTGSDWEQEDDVAIGDPRSHPIRHLKLLINQPGLMNKEWAFLPGLSPDLNQVPNADKSLRLMSHPPQGMGFHLLDYLPALLCILGSQKLVGIRPDFVPPVCDELGNQQLIDRTKQPVD